MKIDKFNLLSSIIGGNEWVTVSPMRGIFMELSRKENSSFKNINHQTVLGVIFTLPSSKIGTHLM